MNFEENNHPVQVNPKAYYDDNMILKIWDTYIRTQNLHYWISESDSKRVTLFNEMKGQFDMSVLKQAGILLTGNDELYVNSEGKSISVCGPVDFYSVKTDSNFNGITFDLEVAINQVKAKVHNNSMMKHTIMFPYHISIIHWGLGRLDLDLRRVKKLTNKFKKKSRKH